MTKYEMLRLGIEVVISAGVVHYLRKIARLVSLFTDYPPHRHVNGKVVYAPDYAPGKVEAVQL